MGRKLSWMTDKEDGATRRGRPKLEDRRDIAVKVWVNSQEKEALVSAALKDGCRMHGDRPNLSHWLKAVAMEKHANPFGLEWSHRKLREMDDEAFGSLLDAVLLEQDVRLNPRTIIVQGSDE